MKKMYRQPAMEIATVELEGQILAVSTPEPAYTPGVPSTRTGYNPNGNTTWE